MNDAKQEELLVKKQFEEQLHIYTRPSLIPKSPALPFFVEWVKKNENKLRFPLKVCEFGGGGGLLLDKLRQRLGEKLILYNAELVERYRPFQTLGVNFVHTSILDSRLESDCFDVVIIRHVLHHLVGKSLRQTQINQQRAVSELFRVTKPGGLIFIEEVVNNSFIACAIIYYLSKLAAKMKLRLDYFQVTPYTVVRFLTQKQFIALCGQCAPLTNWLTNEYERWKLPLCWKLTLLVNDTGVAFITMQKSSLRDNSFSKK